ncbi:septum formation protein Maf [Candidatus Falkowbacteria bacterium RIFOXYB2_FULL_47_14]|uniref:dTTP/UTP pyrophosphatase n=1 Tax=Candidatus Falkowbacteria bacterium RIFOXYA2_FULL_47_19 TaxID=1797994 RepID=A0A1F5SES4_9BACT|nr:MAG: septum formation protein Maf [Candidatus Falkowbacteria bacterium RIFOXYA2_FULL_47_19]OGF35323.1 MAG: septum formation protein Maf [Candidatus Falkowbacteria bacterium RIFOXYC2_FULL_46_15]OGF43764.1 MAG: septum formation protein Maf [Candidatus Falkowbacteria bacterium RIFOXYB2_FULL_47_14]
MKKIILASTSPRRKKLLDQIGLRFKAVASGYEENMDLKMKPADLARYLSSGKARAVAKKYRNAIIIAADTFIALKNEILGKPGTDKQARITLKKISGRTLEVITGLTVIDTAADKEVSRAVITKVSVKKLGKDEIDAYVRTGEPLDKAGAFGIQEKGAVFIKKIDGDYSNVVGLPLGELFSILKKMNRKIY